MAPNSSLSAGDAYDTGPAEPTQHIFTPPLFGATLHPPIPEPSVPMKTYENQYSQTSAVLGSQIGAGLLVCDGQTVRAL